MSSPSSDEADATAVWAIVAAVMCRVWTVGGVRAGVRIDPTGGGFFSRCLVWLSPFYFLFFFLPLFFFFVQSVVVFVVG